MTAPQPDRCTDGCCVAHPGESLVDFTKRVLVAHGHAAPGEDVVFVDNDPSFGTCQFCGNRAELRMGMCLKCFEEGSPREKVAGVRT